MINIIINFYIFFFQLTSLFIFHFSSFLQTYVNSILSDKILFINLISFPFPYLFIFFIPTFILLFTERQTRIFFYRRQGNNVLLTDPLWIEALETALG